MNADHLVCATQTATQPVLADDGQPWGGPLEWPDATAGSQNRSAGVDYDALDRALAQYFENPVLMQGAKTRAIVVVHQVHAHPSWPAKTPPESIEIAASAEPQESHASPGP
jgi:hypothetical protein